MAKIDLDALSIEDLADLRERAGDKLHAVRSFINPPLVGYTKDPETAEPTTTPGTNVSPSTTVSAPATNTVVCAARGYDLRNFTRELMAYWRHLLVIQSGIADSNVLGVADVEVARLRELSRQFSEEDLVRGFHFLAETEKQIKDSPHPRFQLEIGLVKLAQTARLRPLTELLQRLETLESKLGGRDGDVTPRPAVTLRKESTPVAAVTQASPPPLAKPPVGKSSAPSSSFAEEPPDFPDFDQFNELPPDDFSEPVFAPPPSRASKPVPKPAATLSTPRHVAGNELNAIHAELQQISRSPLLAMAFEEAQVSYAPGKLTFVFASDDFNAKKIRESAAIFRDLGERLFGQPLSIEVRLTGEAVAVVDEATQTRARQLAQAQQNPAVRLLLDKFKGEILSVRPAPNAPPA